MGLVGFEIKIGLMSWCSGRHVWDNLPIVPRSNPRPAAADIEQKKPDYAETTFQQKIPLIW